MAFAKGSIEFLTVANEVCKYMEADTIDRANFIDKMRKLIPLLYMKAALVEPLPPVYDEEPEKFVDENDYEAMRSKLAAIMGDADQYLTAVHPDIRYSDTTVMATISESLTDVYQPLKDFVSCGRIGNEDLMNDALIVCIREFRSYWGARLLDAQLALHMAWAADDENAD